MRAKTVRDPSASEPRAHLIGQNHCDEVLVFLHQVRARAILGNHEWIADALFLSSLEEARRQDALSSELRTALSLARLWKERQRGAEAGMLLRPIYSRFTEGFKKRPIAYGQGIA
jgi:predicted ATPase